MKWRNLFNLGGFRHCFDWTPIDVKPPRPRYEFYKDVGRVLLGYEVEVEYMYHGKKLRIFSTDTEKLGLVPPHRALENAIIFYRGVRARVTKYKRGMRK